MTGNHLLHVILDGRKIGDGGIGSHIATLVRAFQERPDIRCTLIIRDRSQLQEAGCLHDDFLVIPARPYSLSEYFMLSRRINFDGIDLFHEPHYTLPRMIPVPSAVTVHDLIHLSHPPRWFHPPLARRLIRMALTRAAVVYTVSQAVARAIRTEFPAVDCGEKLLVVPNGLPADIVPQPRKEVRGRRLLAVVSTAKPHKGVADLLQAFAMVVRRYPDVELCVVGAGSQGFPPQPRVEFLGLVPREKLLSLYRDSLALVVPSLAEGFGIPMLEAKAFGMPAVIRPVPALKELLTSGDVVCANFSVNALVQGLLEICAQPQPQARVPAGWFDTFSRNAIGAATLAGYRAALGMKDAATADWPIASSVS